MARATPSLPVPLSPWMSTVAELSATCCTNVIICFQGGLTPIRLPCPRRSSRRRWRARFCWIKERRSRACRTTRRSWARWSGLVRKSMAPSFMAWTASSTVPNAVRMITSTSGETALASFRSSRPVSPGILRSESSRSTPPWRSRSSAACPSWASTTPYPSRVSVRSRLWRTAGSSYATSSMDWSVILSPLDRQGRREGRAGAGRALPAKRAAVLLDDLPRDIETKARALRLGREELLEQALADIRRDAGTRVLNGDLHVIVYAAGADGELAPPAQRLEPVLHQVQNGLAQERAIDGHGRHRLVRGRLDRAPLARRHGTHELDEGRDHLVDRVLVVLRTREPREGEVLLGDGIQRVDLLANGRHQHRRLLHVRAASLRDEIPHQLGVQLDGRDGIAHLVGDLEGQFAHRGHALGHHELGLRPLEAGQRARELRVEPLHLGTGPSLAVRDHADGEGGQPDQPDENDHGIPAHPVRGECGRRGVEQSRHDRPREAHPGAEVVGVDGEQGDEEQVEEAGPAAREIEQREDEEQVHRERAAEHHPGRARIDADQGEDADLVHGEPEDEGREVDSVPGPEGQAEGGEPSDHHHGEEEGEDTLVPLEETDNGRPGSARRGRHRG